MEREFPKSYSMSQRNPKSWPEGDRPQSVKQLFEQVAASLITIFPVFFFPLLKRKVKRFRPLIGLFLRHLFNFFHGRQLFILASGGHHFRTDIFHFLNRKLWRTCSRVTSYVKFGLFDVAKFAAEYRQTFQVNLFLNYLFWTECDLWTQASVNCQFNISLKCL